MYNLLLILIFWHDFKAEHDNYILSIDGTPINMETDVMLLSNGS